MHLHLCDTIALMTPASWHVFSRRLGALVVFVLLACGAWAGPEWEEGYVFGGRFSEIYDEIEEQGWLKDWLEDDSDLILIDVTGAETVVALSSVTSDWLTVKRPLFEKWTTEIKLKPYAKIQESEEDSGSVGIGLTGAKLGATQLNADLDLQNLKKAFPDSSMFLRIGSGIQSNIGREPDFSSKGFNYWRLDQREGEPPILSLQGENQTINALILAALLSLTLPMVLVGRWIAEFAAKQFGFKTQKGREVYTVWAKRLTVYVPNAAVGVFCFLSIFGFFDQVWALQFQELTGAAVAYPVTSAFLLTHIFIAASFRNKKVFGRNEEEQRAFESLPPRHPLVVRFFGYKLYPQLQLIGLLLIVFGALLFIIVEESVGGPVMLIFGAVLIILWSQITHWIRRKGIDTDASQALIERASSVLASLQDYRASRVPQVKLLKSAHWPKYFALATKQGVFLTPDLIEDFTDEELTMIVAHELAHTRLGHITFRLRTLIFLILVPITILVAAVFVVGSTWALSEGLPRLLAGVWVSMIGYQVLVRLVFPKQEFEADAEAARMVGSGAAAVTAYPKLIAAAELPGLHCVDLIGTHPAMQERIARLKEIAGNDIENGNGA